MKNNDKDPQVYHIEDHLNLPLSEEAAWHIYQFLTTFTHQFEGRHYSQIQRYMAAERMEKQRSPSNDGTPWDDEIPF